MTPDNAPDVGRATSHDGVEADRILASFRQGEVVDLPWPVHTGLLSVPTWISLPVLGLFLRFGMSRVRQFVVVTQTCDIARSTHMRPYLPLAPLIRISDVGTAKRYTEGQTPQFVAVPNAGADAFANLDLIMTAEKRHIAKCPHRPGVNMDPEEIRRFGQGVARKFGRYPFPDYFIESSRGSPHLANPRPSQLSYPM
jgi:hypothetical protein